MTVTTEQTSPTFEDASVVSTETYLEISFSDSQEEIPTIALSHSSTNFPVGTIETSNLEHQDSDDLPIAITVDELVDNTMQYSDVEAGPRSRPAMRAEFVSATFIKATKETHLGIKLGKRENTIASIGAGSPACASPLRVGDRVHSINKKRCSSMSRAAISGLLDGLVGRVTVVVHNKGGHASFVESMVTKPNPKEQCGVSLQKVGNSIMLISNILEKGPFIDSLLNVGDEVLSINEISCRHLSPHEAANIIKESPKCVTVVARSLPQKGVVLAEVSTRNFMFSFSRKKEVAAPEQRRMTTEQVTCVIFCAILIIVAIGVFAHSKLRGK